MQQQTLIHMPSAAEWALTVREVPTPDGLVRLVAPQGEQSLEAYVRDVYQDYDLRALVQPGDTVCEVGTAVGLVPVLLKRWFGDEVHWFGCEPVVWNFLATLGSCMINDVRHNLRHCGLASMSGFGRFQVGWNNTGGASRFHQNTPVEMHCSAPLCTPEEFIAGRKVDVLILDCEGAEFDIVHHLPQCRVIVGESHPLNTDLTGGRTHADVLDVLKQKAEIVRFSAQLG